MNPFVPEDIDIIRRGNLSFRGSLLLTDISGFTDMTEKLALHGKRGTEELSEILGGFFRRMYSIVMELDGSILLSAGDSILVRFPEDGDPEECAARMMSAMDEFSDVQTSAGKFSLGMKIVIGHGQWREFILGDERDAYVYLAGDLVGRIAEAEEAAGRGETVSVDSEREIDISYIPSDHIPDEAFYFTDTVDISGEHRSVTAIFIDVFGYDPCNPPIAQMQELYVQVAQTVARNRGSLQIVDSMMAGGCRIFLLFGAPRSYGDDAQRAVRTGLELEGLFKRWPDLRFSVGIDEGYVYSGVIGNTRRKNYTVIGNVINRASRIADAVGDGTTAVSERVFRMTRNDFVFGDVPSIFFKGSSEKIRLFRPVSRRSDPVYNYKFVGREREMDALVDSVTSGGGISILEGDAGIGKTRLLSKLSEVLKENDISVLSGSAADQGVTNGIFSSLVGHMAGMLEGDSLAVRKSKLWYLINELEDATGKLSRREPFIGSMLFALDYPSSDYNRLPPKLKRENLIDGLCDLIQSFEGRVCIILDDLHNSTDEDLEAVEYICRKTLEKASSRLSYILSGRPGEREILTSGEPVPDRMTLRSLGHQAVNLLMLEMLKGIPLEKELEDLVRSRAEGNPFYLMQFVLYLLEEGLVTREEDEWVRNRNYSDEKLPGSVFSMVMARIDRLERLAKESLRIGSVMGMRFDESVVEMVVGRNVHTSLEECNRAGLTYRSELRELEFVFSHTLIKDVTYDSILRKRRTAIHRSIGKILEGLHSDQPERISPSLAHHFEIAECWPEAVRYSIMAGELAYSEYRNQNAIEHFRTAVGIMLQQVDAVESRLSYCYTELGRICDRIGEYDKALEYYDKALENSESTLSTVDVTLLKADILYTRGEIQESLEMLNRMENLLIDDGGQQSLRLVRMECFRSWAFCVTGKIDIAMEKALKAVQIAENLSKVDDVEQSQRLGYAYNTIATVHWGNGDYIEAHEFYRKALSIARKYDMKREMAVTSGNIGLTSQKMGDLRDAVESFLMQKSLSRNIGEKLIELSSYGSLSNAYASLGQLQDALDSAATYKKLAEDLPAMQDILISNIEIGRINLARGDLETARQFFEKSIQLASKHPYDREGASAVMFMGVIALENGDYSRALDLFRSAEERIRKLQAKGQLLELNILKMRLLMQMGRGDSVRKALDESRELVEEMDIASGKARMLAMESEYLLSEGRAEDATAAAEQAVEIFRQQDLTVALIYCLDLLMRIRERGAAGSGRDHEDSDVIMQEFRELASVTGVDTELKSAILLVL